MKLLLLLLSVLFALNPASAIRVHGDVVTSDDFTYLGKFAYGPSSGNISIATLALDPFTRSVNPSSNIFGQKIALFADMHGEWDTIEDGSGSCLDKLALAGKSVYSIGTVNTMGGMERLNFGVNGRRPHWWYVVLVNCQPDSVINATQTQSIDSATGLPVVVSVRYDVLFTNGGTEWTNQLSWDQHHISEIAITFLIAYVLVFIALMAFVIRSIKQSNNQGMWLILSVVVFCQILNQCLTLAYQMNMIHEETINESINQASWWFDTFSQLGLLLTVLMMALPNQANKRSSIFTICTIMTVYVLGYIAAFVVNARHQADHPSLNEWMFNNWGGYILCAMRLLNIAVIVQMCVQSIQQAIQQTQNQASPRSVLAYVMFASCWLASFPLITLIASMTSTYWRSKFFYGVNCLVTFAMITVQVGVTYRKYMLNRSSEFKTMESSKVEGEVSMSEMNRSPNASNPSSPRSPQSPSQSQFRGITPV